MATKEKAGQVAPAKPVVWGGTITFHQGAPNISKPIPTIADLSAEIDQFLTEKYGYAVGVELKRNDR